MEERMRYLQNLAPWMLAALLLISCGGDDDGPVTAVDLGAPLGEGIVKSVEGAVIADASLAEGQGRLLLDVFHADRAVNRKVKIDLADDGARDTSVARGEGNQEFDLAPGLYFATISYKEGALGEPMTGSIAGLKVNPGHTTKYSVALEAPVGLLHIKFTRSDGPMRPAVNIDDEIVMSIYASGGDRSAPLWEGKGGGNVALPVGRYDVKASYDSGKGLPTVEWYEGLEIAAGLARTKRVVHLDLDASGVRIDAFNFGSDVNGRTQIYFFNPGAAVDRGATMKASGKAGESIAVDPGKYDILIVFTPSDDNPDLTGRLTLPNFEVPERDGVRRPVDLELALGEIRMEIKAGADVVASSSVLEAQGGHHVVPAGTYDIYLQFAPSEGKKVKRAFPQIDLSNGNVWAQSFDAANPEEWAAVPVQTPASPLRPIHWQPEGDDDDSAGDDDDSAGDDTTTRGASGEKPPAPK
jgi:hypothetical protein